MAVSAESRKSAPSVSVLAPRHSSGSVRGMSAGRYRQAAAQANAAISGVGRKIERQPK